MWWTWGPGVLWSIMSLLQRGQSLGVKVPRVGSGIPVVQWSGKKTKTHSLSFECIFLFVVSTKYIYSSEMLAYIHNVLERFLLSFFVIVAYNYCHKSDC